MGEQDRNASALMAGLLRIEAKLDALLEALEGDEGAPETVTVVTMDGERIELPEAAEGDLGLL